MVGAFNNNVTFVTCHLSVCFKNMVLEGAFSSTEGALYHHYLPYTHLIINILIQTKNVNIDYICPIKQMTLKK